MDGEYLLLIDGSSLLSTQYFGNLPREILFAKTAEEKEKFYDKIMMTRKGVYTNAVFGFMRTLLKILKDQKPAYLAVAWDLSRDTFRRELYPDYKGNRSDTPEPLKAQYALMQQVLSDIGIRQFMDDRYEADDFCGSLSVKFEEEIPVRIFTKDHDYLQLVTDRTYMWLMHTSQDKTDEMYRKYRMEHPSSVPDRAFELTPALVKEEFGVEPQDVPALKGLMGDTSDNIKGVQGVGPASAVKLISKYHTVDALYEALRDMTKEKEAAIKKEWKEELGLTRSPLSYLLKTSDTEPAGEASARLSEILATIKKDIPLPDLKLSDLRTDVDKEKLLASLRELEFASLIPEVESGDRKETVERTIEEVTDTDRIEALVREWRKLKKAGVSYAEDSDMTLYTSEENGFVIRNSLFINEGTFAGIIRTLLRSGVTLYTMNGKPFVHLVNDPLRDVHIGAYLLDPLEKRLPVSESVEDSALLALLNGPEVDRRLKKTGMDRLYEEIELPLAGTLARMEETGIQVEKETLVSLSRSLKESVEELQEKIWSLAGENFNINSPKQLGEVLFEHLKLKGGKKTKSGYSTAADILEKLAPENEIVRRILEYRTYAKLNSTYAEGLQSYISEKDGRIHGTFHQTVTATGRISSSDPNLQNIPVRLELGRQLRKVFVPKEGCVFIDADYSQIELRVLAHMSGDENLITSYRSAKDIHAITASQVFGVPLEEVTPLMRRNAKAVNFGIVYGISAFSLSEDLSITRDEAKEYMESYFAAYPKIRGFLNDLVENAKKNGYVTTLYGRRRPIPELASSNFNQRSFGERAAMNSPIQGTAADIMKIAMIRVEKRLADEGMKSKIVLQIHDELLIEAYREEADQVEKILAEEMEHAADLSVRLEVDVKRGNSWYETK